MSLNRVHHKTVGWWKPKIKRLECEGHARRTSNKTAKARALESA